MSVRSLRQAFGGPEEDKVRSHSAKNGAASNRTFYGRFGEGKKTSGERCPAQCSNPRPPNRPLHGAFRLVRNAKGRRCPRPKSATLEKVSIDSGTPRVGNTPKRAKIFVAPNRPPQREFRSIRERRGSKMPQRRATICVAPDRTFQQTSRSIRKHQGSEIPKRWLKSMSPLIARLTGHFDRLGNTKGRRCPTDG